METGWSGLDYGSVKVSVRVWVWCVGVGGGVVCVGVVCGYIYVTLLHAGWC